MRFVDDYKRTNRLITATVIAIWLIILTVAVLALLSLSNPHQG